MGKARGDRKVRSGVVVSNGMDKTVVVKVERLFKHPVYKKYVRLHKKFMAHDEENQCQVGDKVQIVESRPYSKNKCWRVQSVIEKTTEVR